MSGGMAHSGFMLQHLSRGMLESHTKLAIDIVQCFCIILIVHVPLKRAPPDLILFGHAVDA
jgi:hypothetical protein